MSIDAATQTGIGIKEQDSSILEIASEINIICEDCKQSLPAKYFHRYAHKKTGEFIRMKRCNACRQARPKCSKPRSKMSKENE